MNERIDVDDRVDEGRRDASGRDASPFHAGEQAVQARLGVRERVEPWARRIVRDHLPDSHRAFYAQLPFLVLAARDREGRPWATVVAGERGFVSSPDPSTLVVGSLPGPGGALAGALAVGDDVGVLGIELHTRRRNRVNGRVRDTSSDGLWLAVEQSFGNCPQHITEREVHPAPPAPRGGGVPARRAPRLDDVQARLVAGADTFFIASGHRGEGESPAFGMDASHRGGPPGFVVVEAPDRLVFPDYAGNDHFNTLGNLALDPRAALVFADFERGHLLQLTGRAEVDWRAPDRERFPGAERLVAFAIEEVVWREGALPIRFEPRVRHPLELVVVERRRESADVVSLSLAPARGTSLPPFLPGQYLPLALEGPGVPTPVERTYSLSGAPDAATWRISVKRQPDGLGSRLLHDHVRAGDVLRAGLPRGEFVLEADADAPVTLIAAGIGVTPLLSMLHARVARGGGGPTLLVQGVRDASHHPFRAEIARLGAAPGVRTHAVYSRPDPAGGEAVDSGRIDAERIERLLPGLEGDFYLCGPPGFMAALESGLARRGVAPDRIHSESFGPSAGTRPARREP